MFFALDHAIYISTCEIRLLDDGQWSAELKIFFDDLEDALHNMSGIRPSLVPDQLENRHKMIENYLQSTMTFRSHLNHPILFKLMSLERQGDVIICTLKGTGWDSKSVRIEHTLLIEIFGTQKNILTLKTAEGMKALYFRKGNTAQELVMA